MATFHFDLVSPERRLFSDDVDQVDVPGSEGDFGVFKDHAPFITTMRPGILTIYQGGGTVRVVVKGGFAQVSPDGLTVLADAAVPVEEFNPAQLAADIESAEAQEAGAEGAVRDRLSMRVEQLKELQAQLGSGTTSAAH
jgi:F-type H+-transporting ATPase subunit epsilon